MADSREDNVRATRGGVAGRLRRSIHGARHAAEAGWPRRLRTILVCGGLLFYASAGLACSGDCDGNGEVSISELVLAVDLALQDENIGSCTAVDTSHDLRITIDELVLAVDAALTGCPATPTPTGPAVSATPTQRAVCTPPPCGVGDVLVCPSAACPGGCGSECATPTRTPTPDLRTPTCAPTGTPYCAGTGCVPCPTSGPNCLAVPCGSCVEAPQCPSGSARQPGCRSRDLLTCSDCPCDPFTPTPSPPTPTATPAGPTATPQAVCTQPLCNTGSVLICTNGCPGGCGVICATPTPGPICLANPASVTFDLNCTGLQLVIRATVAAGWSVSIGANHVHCPSMGFGPGVHEQTCSIDAGVDLFADVCPTNLICPAAGCIAFGSRCS